jgi:hypothetical protein
MLRHSVHRVDSEKSLQRPFHDPRWQIDIYLDVKHEYCGYLFRGLEDLAAKGLLSYRALPGVLSPMSQHYRGFSVAIMRVRPHGHNKWVTIAYDPRDESGNYDQKTLCMVDLYFKCNYNKRTVPRMAPDLAAKIVPGGAYVPVQPFRSKWSYFLQWPKVAISPLTRGHLKGPSNDWRRAKARQALQRVRDILRSYCYVNETCLALEAYETPRAIVGNRVFFAARAWSEPVHRELVERRVQLLRAAKRIAGPDFEGGFRPFPFAQANYPDLLYRDLSHADFVNLLATSEIIIHTLGCHDCFAWRFGEALAVGRPLLSESLANELPEPLRHEEHVLFFERGDMRSFELGLLRLQTENGLREHLAAGARRYYERWIRPPAMMQRILERTSRLF